MTINLATNEYEKVIYGQLKTALLSNDLDNLRVKLDLLDDQTDQRDYSIYQRFTENTQTICIDK